MSPEDGYQVCDICAVDPASPDVYIPLLSRLWSRHAPAFDSDEAEILTAVNQVNAATGGAGVFYCLASVPDYIILALIQQPDIRAMAPVDETAVIFNEQLSPLSDLRSRIQLPHGKLMFKLVPAAFARGRMANRGDDEPIEMSIFMNFNGLSVQLPDTGRPATLILARITSEHAGVPALPKTFNYLATGVEARTNKQLWSLIQNHYLAGDINAVAVNHKSRFNPSDFRVMTYNRLQLLNVLLQAVIHYETNVAGTVTVDDHFITSDPHLGNHLRDFLVPCEISG